MSAVDIDYITDGSECEEGDSGGEYYIDRIDMCGHEPVDGVDQQPEVLEVGKQPYIDYHIECDYGSHGYAAAACE